jgi:hypothetical protein
VRSAQAEESLIGLETLAEVRIVDLRVVQRTQGRLNRSTQHFGASTRYSKSLQLQPKAAVERDANSQAHANKELGGTGTVDAPAPSICFDLRILHACCVVP